MNRTNWIIFSIGMSGFFASGPFCLPNASRHPWLMAIPASFLLLTLLSSLGALIWGSIRDARNRRHGVPMVGRVIHARQAGYTNSVPTWDVEALLPDGTATRLQVDRRFPFTPGESISLIVNPQDSQHAALPRVNNDF
ncbi:hypothetical protein [Terriglobus sp.]|uniref:hypothetical protein n=1 Tax=Terriglobus sp. TaxID=1889013 RepID=UPI003AFFC229